MNHGYPKTKKNHPGYQPSIDTPCTNHPAVTPHSSSHLAFGLSISNEGLEMVDNQQQLGV